jgi:biopolymer transport protein ExbD
MLLPYKIDPHGNLAKSDNNFLETEERKIRYIYTIYIFYFFAVIFTLSFFLFLFIKSYLNPKGIALNLPTSGSKFFISQEFKRTIIKINQDNLIYFDKEEQPIPVESFLEKINTNCEKNENCQIFLMFDKTVMFENVINIISYLRDSGYKYVAILTE